MLYRRVEIFRDDIRGSMMIRSSEKCCTVHAISTTTSHFTRYVGTSSVTIRPAHSHKETGPICRKSWRLQAVIERKRTFFVGTAQVTKDSNIPFAFHFFGHLACRTMLIVGRTCNCQLCMFDLISGLYNINSKEHHASP